jgi:rhodanese-related sulfurtransferase
MTTRAVKDRLFGEFSRIGKALSSPKRLELLDLITQGEKTVERLAEQTGMGMKNTSAHLQQLRQARLVATRKDGRHVYYRVPDERIVRFLREMQGLAESRLAEVDRLVRLHYDRPEALEPVSADELLRRLHDGDVTVLDVRPEDEYLAGHLPSAISIPVEELERRLGELPREREVVAYCRGPYCSYASEAVELLLERGFRARRLHEGLPDWRARGLTVVTGIPS